MLIQDGQEWQVQCTYNVEGDTSWRGTFGLADRSLPSLIRGEATLRLDGGTKDTDVMIEDIAITSDGEPQTGTFVGNGPPPGNA
jgi:hypothetical protein